MTDSMTVKQQSSSAPVWTAGGAIAGAGIGAGAAHFGYGIPTQAYSTWEDAVKAETDNDSFVSKQAEKSGDDAKNWKTIKEQAEAYQKAQKEVDEFKFPDGFEGKKELDALLDAEDKALKEAREALEKNVKDMTDDAIKADPKFGAAAGADDAEKIKNVREALEKEVKDLTDDAVKNKDEYKNLFTKDGEYKAAQEAFDKVASKDKLDNTAKNGYKAVRKRFKDAGENASKNLTDDILKNCKKPSLIWTGLAAAAGLGILGYIFGKSKDNA